MQLFITDPRPSACARALDDLRLNKQILECVQLLRAALALHSSTGRVPWGNHPVTKWVAATEQNWRWAKWFLCELFVEYTYRRDGRTHGLDNDETWIMLARSHEIPYGERQPFCNCTPHKHLDVHDAYRQHLKNKWAADKRPPKWTNTSPPAWRDDTTKVGNAHQKGA